MRIGELAKRTGVSVRSLRYYEEQGLLASVRTPGRQREFDADAVNRVILIQYFFAAGLNSATIVTMLPCASSGRTTAPMLAALRARREHIEEQQRELAASRGLVEELIAEAGDLLAE